MDEHSSLLLSQSILDAGNHDVEFKPPSAIPIDEPPAEFRHAGSENSLKEQSDHTSPESTASKDRGFAAGTLEHFQHCAIPFTVRLPALLIAIGTQLLALSIVLWLFHRYVRDWPRGYFQLVDSCTGSMILGNLLFEPTYLRES